MIISVIKFRKESSYKNNNMNELIIYMNDNQSNRADRRKKITQIVETPDGVSYRMVDFFKSITYWTVRLVSDFYRIFIFH